MCAWRRKIRAGEEWISLECYVAEHHRRDLTHGMCPACQRRLFPDDEASGS